MSQPFYVAGEWRSSEVTRAVHSPYDGRLVGRHAVPGARDLEDAIAAATRVQAGSTPLRAVRSEWLTAASHLVDDRAEQLARVVVDESGKPLKAARAEVQRLGSTLRWSAEEARRLAGEMLPLDTVASYGSRAGLVTRVPLGPVLGITPFNYPLNLVAHKVGPALAAGCPIIVKPASSTPLSALALADLMHDAGVAPGYLSVLPVSGSDIEPLVGDPRIAKISFTGSAEVGWDLRARAPRARVTLELGGNAAVIVCADADLGAAAERVAWGAFNQAGQSCISAQRVFVERSVYDEFLERLVKCSEALVIGDPGNEATDVGPLIDSSDTDRVASWVEEAVARGARIATGGEREGDVYRPTVLTGVAPDMRVSCEEVFGPVVSVSPFDDFDDALAAVNESRFGLQGSVFTESIQRAFAAYARLEVGGVILNDVASWRADEMPYGGVKESGSGREGIRYAMQEMTEPRLLVLNGVRW
jgi:acyl-CoA reductase-like NAD-dependent aldehyde dehydrogenase